MTEKATNSDEENNQKKREKNEVRLNALVGLLDFYSDRAVAHASFLVACIFGLFSLLSLVREMTYWHIYVIAFVFWMIFYSGAYCLWNFGFYAVSAVIIKGKIKKIGEIEEIEQEIFNEMKEEKMGRVFKYFTSFKLGGELDVKEKGRLWENLRWIYKHNKKIIFILYFGIIGFLPSLVVFGACVSLLSLIIFCIIFCLLFLVR